jgi:hypothetical protein
MTDSMPEHFRSGNTISNGVWQNYKSGNSAILNSMLLDVERLSDRILNAQQFLPLLVLTTALFRSAASLNNVTCISLILKPTAKN